MISRCSDFWIRKHCFFFTVNERNGDKLQGNYYLLLNEVYSFQFPQFIAYLSRPSYKLKVSNISALHNQQHVHKQYDGGAVSTYAIKWSSLPYPRLLLGDVWLAQM